MVASHLTWEKGGTALVVELVGDAIVLSSTTPAPPGARLDAHLSADPSVRVKIKSHGTQRQSDGRYALKGRVLDAPRELRATLEKLVQGSAETACEPSSHVGPAAG
jgi:hypothetical protein